VNKDINQRHLKRLFYLLRDRGLLIMCLLALVSLLNFFEVNQGARGMVQGALIDIEKRTPPPLAETINSLPILSDSDLALTAQAALVFDLDNNRLVYAVNAEKRLPVASLTKLTTALLASRHLSPDQVIAVNEQNIANIASPRLGLVLGEQISVAALMEGMLVASANDAAEVLAAAIGGGDRQKTIVMMNSLALNLGLRDTSYANPTGFDDPKAYSTAKDILALVLEIGRNPWLVSVLSETGGQVTSVDGRYSHSFNTTNSLLRNSHQYVTGGKTGYTDEARGNLVVFAENMKGTQMAAVVLGSDDREADMSRLLELTFNKYDF